MRRNRRPLASVAALVIGLRAVIAAAPASEPVRRVTASDVAPTGLSIVVFSDFQCPYCALLAPTLRRVMTEFPDRVHVVFKHMPLGMHADAPLAHLAALAAGEQGKFWDMHDLLFADQKHLDEAAILDRARSIDLDLPAFRASLRDSDNMRRIAEDIALAQALGVNATPTMFVNGQRVSGAQDYQALKQLVAPEMKAVPSATVLADRARFDVTGAPALGPEKAPVSLVLFSDFQCPFCSRVASTIRELNRLYPDELRIVFKHYPLPIHPAAPLVHAAASAAASQGKFWEFHDRIFGNQKAVGRADLARVARELALDVDQFERDLDADQSQVAADIAQGKALGVTGTPTAFINGRAIGGAVPIERFQQVIDSELGLPTPSRTSKPSSESVPAQRSAAVRVMTSLEVRESVARGPAEAPVTLQWFSDLGSPLTRKAYALIREIERHYPGQIRIAFHHLPLESQAGRMLLHYAAEAAADQGRFWAFHDRLLDAPIAPTPDELFRIGHEAGLDDERLASALDQAAGHAGVENDLATARRKDIRGTPTFFVNGQRVDGLQPLPFFEQLIDAELATAGRQ